MKKKDFSELKNKSVADLKKMLTDIGKEGLEKKMQNSQTKLKNMHVHKSLKKSIAQIKTLIRIKEIELSIKKGEQ